jgi:nicotinamidase-related amidase
MLERNKAMLIVTDVQGKLASLMYERDELFRSMEILIEGAKILDLPILWVEQYPEGLGPTVKEIAAHLKGLSPFPKKTFSSLRDPVILKTFEEIKRSQVILSGIETHVCIYQTAIDLLNMGIETHIPVDAVSSRTLMNKHIGIEKITRAGGDKTSVETLLFELLKVGEGDEFRKITKLIK